MRTPLNDLELQRLKTDKAELPVELIREFDQSLADFVGSVRFQLLRTFQISHFLGAQKLGVEFLDTCSFEMLANISTYDICMQDGVQSETLRCLTAVLHSLAVEDDLTDAGTFLRAEDIVPLELGDEINHASDHPAQNLLAPHFLTFGPTAPGAEGGSRPEKLLSSVEAERLLRDAIGRLKELESFNDVRNRVLGTYWDPNGVAAPFVEALTFGQLAEMKLANLLDKRTFTDQKVLCVVRAIDALCEECEGTPAEHLPVVTSGDPPSHTGQVIRWPNRPGELSPVAEAVLGWAEALTVEAQGRSDFISQLTCALPSVLSAEEFLSLWVQVTLLVSSGESGSVVHFEQQTEFAQSGARKLEGFFTSSNRTMCSQWRAVLSGPGVSETVLFEPYIGVGTDPAFERLLLRMLVVGLGAERPTLQGVQIDRHWTCNEAVFSAVIQGLLFELPIGDMALQERLRTLLPLFDVEPLNEAFHQSAQFDSDKKCWRKKNS